MGKNRRPTKGAHALEVERYAKSLNWREQDIRNSGHSVWVKETSKIAIPRGGRQPLATGTLIKILKELESV